MAAPLLNPLSLCRDLPGVAVEQPGPSFRGSADGALRVLWRIPQLTTMCWCEMPHCGLNVPCGSCCWLPRGIWLCFVGFWCSADRTGPCSAALVEVLLRVQVKGVLGLAQGWGLLAWCCASDLINHEIWVYCVMI